MAFHVDYWDYLGWKDRFSDKAYSERQKNYATYYKSSTVYTPAFFINGVSWRPGWYNKVLHDDDLTGSGVLSLSLNKKVLNARYVDEMHADQNYVLHVVILGMGLETDILRGENAARQARHEFVVLSYLNQNRLLPEWRIVLDDLKSRGESQQALIAWVTHEDNPRPLQVAGGLLEDNIQH